MRFSLIPAGMAAMLVSAAALAQPAVVDELERQRRDPGATPWVPQQNRVAAEADRQQFAEPSKWLQDARSALRAGRPGQANELLERAETRLLTRSTLAAAADQPLQSPTVRDIGAARTAILNRDRAGAERAIDQAIASLR
jgi:hypothetical protein